MEAVAIGHQHVLDALGIGRGHLLDPRVERPGYLVGAAQQADLPLDGHVAGVDSHRRGARQLVRRRVGCLVELAPLGDPPCGSTGKGNEVVDVRDVAVRVGGPLALRDADAGALIDAADGVLDAAVVEDELQRLVPLPVELGPVATT